MKKFIHRSLCTAVAALMLGAFAQADEELDALIAQLRSTPYSNAVQKAYQKRLLTLLPRISAGESVDTVLAQANGTTALHNACGLSHVEIVRWLVNHGANTKAKTAKGASVAMCVAPPNHKIINKILNSAPAKGGAAQSAAGLAPASVAGKTFSFINPAGETFTYTFRKGNSDIVSNSIPPEGYGNSLRYTKTGPNTATIVVEEWESISTITLTFTSPHQGTATDQGYGEGEEWNHTGISFSVK